MKKFLRVAGYTLFFIFVLFNILVASQAYYLTHFYYAKDVKERAKWKEMLLGKQNVRKEVKDQPSSPFENITITTSDNVKLQGWYVKADSTPRGTLLMFHGHASSRSGIVNEIDAFHKLGWNVCTVDFRAHGNSEGDVSTVGYREAKDVKAVYDYIEKKKEKNIAIWGISMGAATAMKAIADYDLKPAKLIIEMPFGSLHEAVRGRLHIMHLPREPLATFVTFWGGAEQGFWAFDLKPTEYAKKVNCPVLLQWGTNDPRVSESEIHEIFKNLQSQDKLMIKYVNSAHESLHDKETEKWLAVVTPFMDSPKGMKQ